MAENPSKRAVQRFILGRILRHPHKKVPITVVCLPGESCWDVRFFSGYSRVQKIIALEKDPEVAEVIRAKTSNNPKVEVIETSTSKFLAETEETLDLIYLDYYSNFNLAVMQDLQIIFRRKLLEPGGKCVVGFYAARESEHAQVAQRFLFEDLDTRVPSEENWEDMEFDRRRCVAFNSLVARYRLRPVRPLPQGHPERTYATTTAPLWYRYPTDSASMLVGYFTLNTHNRTSTTDAIKQAKDCWYVRGNWSIRDVKRTDLGGLSSVEGAEFVRDIYKKEILDFYDKHFYTPTVPEVGRTSVKGWIELIRELGLCPRQHATKDEVKTEIQRIYERQGIVRWVDLRRAKLSRRNIFVSGNARTNLRKLLDEMGILHDVRSEVRKRKDAKLLSFLRLYLQHLESGKPKTQAPHYSSLRNRGLIQYDKAVRELRRLERLEDSHGPLDTESP